jgi:hypothetical protein
MTVSLDPATLRVLASDLDVERETEHRAAQYCGCGNPAVHAVRVGLLDDLAARYRTRALKVEIDAKEAL